MTDELAEKTPLLEAKAIDKHFPGVYVLKHVDFTVMPGEVHALMGENGAGKSTLIKIITGVYPMDSGTIYIKGKEVSITTRKEASENGIAVIYQELSLIPTLSVTENIFLGQEKLKGKIFLNRKEMRKKVQQLINQYQFGLKPDDIIETLSIAHRQTVEIMKALITNNAQLIIMDEPTASLNTQESEVLFGIIKALKKEGKSIIYISHRLEEVYALADKLTVLRNGEVAGILEKGEIDALKVIHMMLGKNLDVEKRKVVNKPKENAAVLKLKNVCSEKLNNISFCAYGGQILGIGGLVGSGRTEVLRSIFGLDNYQSGEISLNNIKIPHKTSSVMKMGVGLVPEDRRIEGLVPGLTIERNITLASYDRIATRGIVSEVNEKKMASDAIVNLDIRPANQKMLAMNLSGGNQQKVVLGKWLREDLKVLLVDEPTVGIDVGAKSEIYGILHDMAAKGCIVLVVSSDMEELLKISDRIIVLVKGHVFKEMINENITQDDILAAASGIDQEVAKA